MIRAHVISMPFGLRRSVGIGSLVVIGAGFVLAPWLVLTNDYSLSIGTLALYMACLTATWSLLAGVSGQFSFAHVAIAGLAAYSGAIWGRELAHQPMLGSLWMSLVVGVLFAVLVGTLLGLLLLRLKGAYLALFTIAFAQIALQVVISESDLTGGRLSLPVVQFPGNGLSNYYLVLVTTAGILILIYGLLRTRVGLFLRAMREEPTAAEALGVDTTRLKILVFSVTSAMIGLAASVYFHTTLRLVPEYMDLLPMSFVIVYAVVGGIESPLAGALAAVGMTFLTSVLARFEIGSLSVELGIWRYAVLGLLLMLTIRVARNGLLGPALEFLSGQHDRHRLAFADRSTEARSHVTYLTDPLASKPVKPAVALRLDGLRMSFGYSAVLHDIQFELDEPQICGLIGPNGAGKTTLVNLIAGELTPTGGAIYLAGERIDGLPPHAIGQRGVARTFQISRAFRRMTVLDNVLVPSLAVDPSRSRRIAEARALEVLEQLRIRHMAHEFAGALSGGQLKLLELARALMLDPRIMILDEPFAGVHPALRELIRDFILKLRTEGRTFIIIEHDLDTVFALSERVLVLAAGRLIADGQPDQVRRDPVVVASYLGSHVTA